VPRLLANQKGRLLMGYIYCITNKITNKQYVGKTERDCKTRWREHQNSAFIYHIDVYLYRSMRKYGILNFEFKIIDMIENDLICDKEMYWISKLSTLAPKGYNLTSGGEGKCGYVVSEETRHKISIANKGKKKRPRRFPMTLEQRHRSSLSHTGKVMSEETIAKMKESLSHATWHFSDEARKKISETHKGKPISEEQKLKIIRTLSHDVLMKDKNSDEVLHVFTGSVNACKWLQQNSKYTKASFTNIVACCNKKPHYNTAYGYKWEYANNKV